MVDNVASQMTAPCKSLAMSFTAFPCTSTCRVLGLPGTSFTMGDIQIPLPWKQKGECLQHIKDKTEFENYNSGSYTSASFCFCYSIDPCLSGCGYDAMSCGIIILTTSCWAKNGSVNKFVQQWDCELKPV